MRNVSRAWAYETGLAAGVELGKGASRKLPSQPSPVTGIYDRNPHERVLRVLWSRL